MTRRIRIFAAPTEFGRWVLHAACLALVLTATSSGGAIAADKIVLQLHREPQFAFAGYYAALWKGFYREAGLEVEIKPGTPPGATPIDPVREVTERRAQFGTGSSQLLIRTAPGLPLLLLAPIFQQSGTAVYYRADGDFSAPHALLSAKIGRPPPSNFLDVELRTALHSEGIDPDKLRSVSIEPGQAIAALADHRIDAVIGSVWEFPWQARERSVALKSYDFAFRPEFYGDGLFALQRFANADPATTQRFREASVKGWEYALQHPDEIAARIVAELPGQVLVSDPAGFARYQSEVARKLARFPDVPLGQSNSERWNGIQQSLIAIGAISRPVDLDAFIYNPDAVAGGFPYRLVLLILGAGAVCAFFVAADRFWWRRLRSRAVSAEAFNAAEIRKRIAASLNHIRPVALARPGLTRLRTVAHDGFDRARKIARRLAASTAGGGPALRPIDLNVTLTGLEGLMRRRLPEVVSYRLSLLPEPRFCHAVSNAVTAMIRDLVAEAANDMPNGGELVLGTRQCTIDHAAAVEFPGSAPGDYVRVTVKDSGCGLSAERLEHIFYPETTVRPAVAAAWQLTHRLGGFAAVESAEGVGTAVHLYFRRAVENGESAEAPITDEFLKAAE
jgi:ABC-type nitrate/sulfonate/bicarbonate transport system substrate-binding protein